MKPEEKPAFLRALRARRSTKSESVKTSRKFIAYGASAELFSLKDPQLIISGPAETGKTIACLHLLDSLAWKYPGMQGAIIRKTYRSMPGSVLQTFEKKVLTEGDGVTKRGGEKPEWFDYPNTSRLWIGGMDNAAKVLSSERDVIYVNQTEELTLDEWETLTTRATGRAGNMPYAQVIGDCNPGAFSHWIKASANTGKIKLLESRHEDNPTLYDQATGLITPQGERSLEALDRLTGVRYLRLRKGLWAAAEGSVYDTFDRVVHIQDQVDSVPAYYLAGVDWGFTNPGVIQVWGIDGDKRMIRVREVYRTKKTIDWWILQAIKIQETYKCTFICDPSEPGYIQQFRNADLTVIEAFNDISLGINNVQQRLGTVEDKRPRLIFLRDGLTERDEELAAKHKPTCAEEEIEAYVWPKGKDGKALKEVPMDDNNHAMDAMRYVAAHVDDLEHKGEIEDLEEGIAYELDDYRGR